MNRPARARTRWLLVVVFAIGMAWVEAATVYYLRVMVDRLDPYQANPLPMSGMLGQVEHALEASTLCWRLNWIGIALALYVFMADALRTVHEGMEATRTVLPTAFNWSVFVVALALMAAPVAHIAWRMRPMNLLQDIRSPSV